METEKAGGSRHDDFAFSSVPAVPAQAAGSYETQVTSEVQLGAVNIMLTETETDESGKEVGATHGRLVTPGATVEDIVRITNQANDVWIRVKIGYHTEDGELTFADNMISPDPSDWIQRGEYWYCTHVLEKGEAEEFIREIKIRPHGIPKMPEKILKSISVRMQCRLQTLLRTFNQTIRGLEL